MAPPLLGDVNAELANSFEVSFGALFKDGNASLVIALANTKMAPHGSRLVDGNSPAAPKSWWVTDEHDAEIGPSCS